MEYIKAFEYPHFNLIAECYGRTLAHGGDTILMTPGHTRYTYKCGTLNYNKMPTDPWRPCHGYAVGGVVPAITISMIEFNEGSMEWATAHPQVLWKKFKRAFEQTWHAAYEHGWKPDHPLCVGTWVNGEDIVFDVVTLVDDQSVATRLGTERGELCIYSIEKGEEITCPVPLKS
jgi:hypothetical protein